MTGSVPMALGLTAVAGMATAIGSLLGLIASRPGPRFMGFTLGFSAGVMILVSFVELLQTSINGIGFVSAHMWFFLGMAVYFMIDFFVPHDYIGQHDHKRSTHEAMLMRTGMMVALGLGIHNFPEGMATFVGALNDPKLGVAIAVAIAIHNIPEGLAVSAPIFAATGSRAKAFWWSALSGLAEPVGAGVAALFLLPFLTEGLLNAVLAIVAGIMIAISVDELVPAAKAYGDEHTPIIGVMAGMIIMAASLHILAP